MTSCTDICRSILIERLISKTLLSEVSSEFEEHKNYVFNLLKSTVLTGENNSALIIGPRGSGKTTVRYFKINQLCKLNYLTLCDNSW